MMGTPATDLISDNDKYNKQCLSDSSDSGSDVSFFSVNESEGELDTMEKVDTLIGGRVRCF